MARKGGGSNTALIVVLLLGAGPYFTGLMCNPPLNICPPGRRSGGSVDTRPYINPDTYITGFPSDPGLLPTGHIAGPARGPGGRLRPGIFPQHDYECHVMIMTETMIMTKATKVISAHITVA